MTGSRTKMLAYLTAFTVVLVTGLVHGLWSRRWADDADLQAAVASLDRVPLDLGDWRGEVLEMDPAMLVRAEVAGCLFRRYTHRPTGQSVNVTLLCGRFGPVTMHTPDICFRGVGFQTMEPPARVSLSPDGGARPADLWTARFDKKSGSLSQYLRVFWSWSAGAGWQAPDYPRLAFRAAPVLFKIYVVRDMARSDEPLDAEPGAALLRRLLPELDVILSDGEW